jgi:organic hydroperoxide reductase OsmC/OhrA
MSDDEVVHRYSTTCAWHGSTAEGYELYDRTHRAEADPAAVELALSSDPAFHGDPALLNPEQLLVLSAASCQLLSFLAVAARARVDIVDYVDESIGEMPEAERPMSVTRITLRPQITVRGPTPDDRLQRLVQIAHDECFIANSLRTEVIVEPTFNRADG